MARGNKIICKKQRRLLNPGRNIDAEGNKPLAWGRYIKMNFHLQKVIDNYGIKEMSGFG